MIKVMIEFNTNLLTSQTHEDDADIPDIPDNNEEITVFTDQFDVNKNCKQLRVSLFPIMIIYNYLLLMPSTGTHTNDPYFATQQLYISFDKITENTDPFMSNSVYFTTKRERFE